MKIKELITSIKCDPQLDRLVGEEKKLQKELTQYRENLAGHTTRAAELENAITNMNNEAGRASEIRLTTKAPIYDRLNHFVESLQTVKGLIDDLRGHIVLCEKALEDVEKEIRDIYANEDRRIDQAVAACLATCNLMALKAELLDVGNDASHAFNDPGKIEHRLTSKIVKKIHAEIYPQ